MNNKIVTLFGGSGFTEGSIVKSLLENKFLVRIITTDIKGTERFKVFGKPGHLSVIEGDVTQSDKSFDEWIKGSFIVINAIHSIKDSDVNSFLNLHSKIPEEIAKHCKIQKVEKFIHLSDLSAESIPSVYARSRSLGEKTVLTSFEKSVVLKTSMIYDLNDDFVFQLFNYAKKYSVMPIISNCEAKIQPIFSGDFAAIVLKICQNPEQYNGLYRLAGSEIMTMQDMHQTFEKILNKKVRQVKLYKTIAKMLIAFFNLKIMFPVNRIIFGDGKAPFYLEQMKMYCHNTVIESDNLLNKMGLKTDGFESRLRMIVS